MQVIEVPIENGSGKKALDIVRETGAELVEVRDDGEIAHFVVA